MRIAWVSPYLPEPAASGGVIRQQRLAAALAQHAELHLFARGEPWEHSRLNSRELDFFASRWLGRDYWPWRSLPTCVDALPPRRVRLGSPRNLWRAVQRAHARAPFDGVVVSHSWAALGAESLALPWVLDEHNVESHFFRDLSRSAGADAAGLAASHSAFQHWERRVWRGASGVTCVSDDDAADIAAQRAARAADGPPLVVQNGADLEHLDRADGTPRHGGVLFVGSMHHRPNLLAALRLVESIMPRVWHEQGDVTLTIVGGPVSRELQRAARKAAGRVVLLGRVADVAPQLAAERVFVNPVVHGAGSSLKTVEAIASGIPLVSTEFGARGFALVPGEHYARAEDDGEFAVRALLALRGDPETQRRARRAREHARRFTWSALSADFAGYVQRVLTQRAPG